MKCHKCKATIDDDSKYCTYCGTLINKNKETKKEELIKERLLDIYLDNKNDTIREKSFSLPQLLLGSFYLLYRKMYIYAIPSILLFIISLFFAKYALLILIIRNVIFAFYFNTIYFINANNKVDKIIDMDIPIEEKVKLCQKLGGTSFIPIVISLAIIFVLGIILIVLYATVLISTGNSMMNDNDSPELYDLKYNVPENFKTSNFNDQFSKYYSYMDEEYNYCSFTINQNDFTTLYPTVEKYLKTNAIVNSTDTLSDIKKVTINNYEWQGIVISSNNLKYIYATKYKGRIYSLEFNTTKELDPCSDYYKSVLQSLRFK